MARRYRHPAALAASALMAGAAGPALAQSSVTIYGLMDLGLVREFGAAIGPATKVSSGMSNGSRLGIKGVEPLGGGWDALFLLESGIQLDDGSIGQGGVVFGRQAYAGLRSPLGTLTVGGQYTPHFDTMVMVDPFGTGTAGDAKNLIPSSGDATTRMTNTIKLATAAWRGLTAELVYAPGEIGGNDSAGRQFGGAVTYLAGPLNLRLGYHYRNSDTPTLQRSSARNTLLAATYQFTHIKAHLAWGIDKGVGSSILRNAGNPYGYASAPGPSEDSTDLLVGLSAARGAHTFMASFIHKDEKTARNQDAAQVALGHRYALSRRTDTYAVVSHISNRRGASYTVGHASDVGNSSRVYSVGVRHLF